MIRIRNLQAGYGQLKVLRKVSMHVHPGEIVTIIGANGAGKTTLLKTISGLIRAREGEITFHEKDIHALPPEKIVSLGCSLVPEGRQLFGTMTVLENLLIGGYARSASKDGGGRLLERIYSLFPLLKERERQLAGTLSGGEQQMLAIGRAMMADPAMIMMDEPSMGLSPIVVRDIFNVIRKLKDGGCTILLVEQNARSALRIADRGYVIESGRMVLQGPAEDLLQNRDIQRAYLGRDLDSEVKP